MITVTNQMIRETLAVERKFSELEQFIILSHKMDIQSVGFDGKKYSVVVGSCGRNFDRTKTFSAVKMSTITNQLVAFVNKNW